MWERRIHGVQIDPGIGNKPFQPEFLACHWHHVAQGAADFNTLSALPPF
jgi:hypothetical protein